MAINIDHKNNVITTDNSILDFQTTGAIRIPVGTTVQRPSSPLVGFLRYNSSINSVEVYLPQGWSDISPFKNDGSYVFYDGNLYGSLES